MFDPAILVTTLLLWAAQAAKIDGTWELVRIFKPGAARATRAVPVDSTVYLRLTLLTHHGGWMEGRLYRRYFGQAERSKIEAGPLRGTDRYIIGVELDHPTWQRARTAAWLAGGRLRLGTSLVPDADSLELRRVAPDAPYPAAVQVVVTAP
ncbi:MAG: hypothetical protein AUH42_06810 [Gemmatimonadetes bacterium 13_1_40CM_70_11]|nr:MAG: hypothetical protein AUH42_06810 [Gemmatimonadetes bacterium 13_1_40CM_70_11]